MLAPVEKRVTKVEEDGVYRLLKVTYECRVLEGDTIDGADLSYSQLSKVETWDVVLSNMGVGRGAIGIVPQHLAGSFVSRVLLFLMNTLFSEPALLRKPFTTQLLSGLKRSSAMYSRSEPD